jgi:hypothetical protein
MGLRAAQSADPLANQQNAPQITAEQQKQLNDLKGLEQQFQKDREGVHAAISQYGRNSNKTDARLKQGEPSAGTKGSSSVASGLQPNNPSLHQTSC